jgi:DNA invertase Pin-like site-specific DNA recombinase
VRFERIDGKDELILSTLDKVEEPASLLALRNAVAARLPGSIGRRSCPRSPGRPPKLEPQQQQEIVKLVKRGKKTAADAARLFGVHPATVSRLLQRT